MTLPEPPRMGADAFLARAMEQEGRHELASGEVVAMAPERAAHARAKLAVARALGDAVRHHLIPRTDTRSAIHHARGGDGVVTTTIAADGVLVLDPPGMPVALGDVFAGG